MRAETAASYLQASNLAISIRSIKIAEKQVPADLELPLDGTSKLEISIEIDVDSVFDTSQLDESSEILLVLDAICDNLRIRETIKTWQILPSIGPWSNIESAIGLLPNAVINNGLQLDLTLCVINPQPKTKHSLACDFNGGILARYRVPVSVRGEGPLLPIEFIRFDSTLDPIWQIHLDLENGLDAPSSSAFRVYISEKSYLADGLKSALYSNESNLAFSILIHAISDDVIRYVMFDDDIINQLIDANRKILTLPQEHWSKVESTIGYLLNSWIQQLCNGNELGDIVAEYRMDPSDQVMEIRKRFPGWRK